MIYHLNSNGLMKRANQGLKNFLWKFMQWRNEWVDWLNQTKWVLNSWAHRLQKLSFNELLTQLDSTTLKKYNKKFAFSKVTQKVGYKIEDKIWLKTERACKSEEEISLNKIYEGPYIIWKMSSNNTYKLDIKITSDRHLNFHFCKLKKAFSNDLRLDTTRTQKAMRLKEE